MLGIIYEMELVLVFIVTFIAIGIISATSKPNNTRFKCHELGVRHEWVVRGTEENTYLVCKKCHLLPSGETEEQDGGKYDF